MPPGNPQPRICELPELSWGHPTPKLLTRELLQGSGCGWARGRAGVRAWAFLWKKRARVERSSLTAPARASQSLSHRGKAGSALPNPATQPFLQFPNTSFWGKCLLRQRPGLHSLPMVLACPHPPSKAPSPHSWDWDDNQPLHGASSGHLTPVTQCWHPHHGQGPWK